MSFKFLEAFVEFTATGHDSILSTADRIQQKIRSIDLSKAAHVQFTAGGTDKVEGAVNTIRQKLAGLAQGGDLTRMLSGSIASAFQQGGTEALGTMSGTMGTAMGAMLGGAIGAAIASAVPLLSMVPKAVGEQIDISREAGALRERSLTPEQGKIWQQAVGPERAIWSKSQADIQGVDEIYKVFQQRLPDNPTDQQVKLQADKATAFINQVMTLRAGGGTYIKGLGELETTSGMKSFAEDFTALEATHRVRQKISFASNPAVMEELEKHFTGKTPEQIQEAIRKKDNVSGAITTEDLQKAFSTIAMRPAIIKGAEEQLNQNRWQHFRETGGALWQGENQLSDVDVNYMNIAKTKEGRRLYYQGASPEVIKRHDQLEQIISIHNGGGLGGLPGMQPTPWAEHEISGSGKQFAFTSLSGLVEKMQQEASGGGDVQDRQLQALSKIEENTRKDVTPAGHGAAGSW